MVYATALGIVWPPLTTVILITILKAYARPFSAHKADC